MTEGSVQDVATVGDFILANTLEGDVLSLDSTTGAMVSLSTGNLDEVYDIGVLSGGRVAIAYNSNVVRCHCGPAGKEDSTRGCFFVFLFRFWSEGGEGELC